MISLDTIANYLQFSKNRIYFALSSNKLPISGAVAAVYKIELVGAPNFTDGASISFKWGIGEESVEMVMLGTSLPGTDNAYYYLTSQFVTADVALADATPHFKANYYINRDWIVTVTTTEILFTARNKGAAYNMVFDTTDPWINFTQVTAGQDDVLPANFGIQADVYIQEQYDGLPNANPYTRLKTILHRASENNTVEFDFKELLHPYLGVSIPVLGENPTLCVDINKRWFVEFSENYGVIPVAQKHVRVPTVPAQTFRVIKGGLNHQDERAGIGWYGDVIEGYFKNEAQFLTWKRNIRTVTPNQPEWLYLLHTNNAAEVYVKCKVYYTDNTTVTFNAHSVLTGEFNNNIWRYAVGYNQINVGAQDPSKTVSRYDIWFENDQANQITSTLTYLLEIEHHYERFLLFENSLGGFDTIRIEGAHTKGVEVSASEFERLIPYNFSADSFEATGNYNTQFTDEFEASTGALKDPEELDYLTELLISQHVYLIDPVAPANSMLPVKIERASYKLVIDDNTAFALNFKYSQAFNQTQYSKLGFI